MTPEFQDTQPETVDLDLTKHRVRYWAVQVTPARPRVFAPRLSPIYRDTTDWADLEDKSGQKE